MQLSKHVISSRSGVSANCWRVGWRVGHGVGLRHGWGLGHAYWAESWAARRFACGSRMSGGVLGNASFSVLGTVSATGPKTNGTGQKKQDLKGTQKHKRGKNMIQTLEKRPNRLEHTPIPKKLVTSFLSPEVDIDCSLSLHFLELWAFPARDSKTGFSLRP